LASDRKLPPITPNNLQEMTVNSSFVGDLRGSAIVQTLAPALYGPDFLLTAWRETPVTKHACVRLAAQRLVRRSSELQGAA
jgi:hypothetical protein